MIALASPFALFRKEMFFILSALLPCVLSSQNFQAVYSYTPTDHMSDVKEISTGYVIVADIKDNSGNIESLFFETDKSGNIAQKFLYGDVGDDVPGAIIPVSGGYVIYGTTNSYTSGGDWDLYLMKTNLSGNILWQKTYGGSGDEQMYFGPTYNNQFVQTSDGGFAMVAYTNSTGPGSGSNSNTLIIKTDAGGTLQWSKTYGGNSGGDDTPASIVQTSDNGFFVTGYTGAFPLLVYCLKTDASGNVQWQNTYDIKSGSFDEGHNGIQTSDGAYAVTGTGEKALLLLKLNSSGSVAWAKEFYQAGHYYIGQSLIQSSTGMLVVAAGEAQIGSQTTYTSLLKTDLSGNLFSATKYDPKSGPEVIWQTSDGGFLMGGAASGGMYVVKTDSSGHTGCDSVLVISVKSATVIAASYGTTGGGITSGTASFSKTVPGLSQNIPCLITASLSATALASNPACGSSCNGEATAAANGGQNPFSYLWSNGKTEKIISGLCAGSYSVTVTDLSGSTAMAGMIIVQSPSLAAVSSQTNISCFGGSNGSAQVLISGGAAPFNYLWSNGLTTSSIYNLTQAIYNFTVSDQNGCTLSLSFNILQPAAISATITTLPDTCFKSKGLAVVTAAGGTGALSYLWGNGETTSVITQLSSKNYSVTISDADFCSKIISANVGNLPGPVAVTSSSGTHITAGSSSLLHASGGTVYFWFPSTGLSCSSCSDPVATPNETSNYCVEVSDNNNCKDTSCVNITVDIPCGDFFNPSAFSPNNDGENDMLCLKGITCFSSLKFSIYDRWGDEVFSAYTSNVCWDGIYKSKIMDAAVFYYVFEGIYFSGEAIKKRGNITLVK